jgi:hypothetical protein
MALLVRPAGPMVFGWRDYPAQVADIVISSGNGTHSQAAAACVP